MGWRQQGKCRCGGGNGPRRTAGGRTTERLCGRPAGMRIALPRWVRWFVGKAVCCCRARPDGPPVRGSKTGAVCPKRRLVMSEIISISVKSRESHQRLTLVSECGYGDQVFRLVARGPHNIRVKPEN